MCFSFFPFFWKNSLKELEREDQELSFFLFFSLFALLCLVSLCFSFFFFFWLGNGGFHSEAGETLEGSFSAISKSNFASKILNTKLELESLRKRDWKTMDIDEKKAKISRKLLKFAKIFAKKITHSQKKSFCKKWRWISSTVNRSGHQDGGYFRDSSRSTGWDTVRSRIPSFNQRSWNLFVSSHAMDRIANAY